LISIKSRSIDSLNVARFPRSVLGVGVRKSQEVLR
jgi:hypothetical protein